MALALAVAPALWIGWQAWAGSLGPRPVTAAIHQSGDWAIRFLVISLAISPLQRLLHWPRLIGARQIFGLCAVAYAALHVALYVVDQKFAPGRILSEIVQRVYLGIGSMAFIGLLILAVNSGEAAIRRLGGQEWRALHRSVYALAPLALTHFFIQSRLDVTEPLILAGLLCWSFWYRLLPAPARTNTAPLLALALASAVATQVIELIWYAVASKIPAASIASGIFDFDSEIRPMWVVFAITLAAVPLPWLGRATRHGQPGPGRPALQT